MTELTRELTGVQAVKEVPATKNVTSQNSLVQTNVPQSLEQRRLDLCAQLQANRRELARKLVGPDPERDNQFPRSAAMRFISNHSTREILHKAANAALGLQTFRALRWGVSAMKFVRSRFRKII